MSHFRTIARPLLSLGASSSPGNKNGTAGEQGDGSPAISALLTSPVPLENSHRV
jgi:hypothetical protein